MRLGLKKILATTLCPILLIGALAGCAKPQAEETKNEVANTETTAPKEEADGLQEAVTLRIANYAVLEKGYEPFWTAAKKEFEEKNSNIIIEWITAPYGEIQNQVTNLVAGGEKIDLVFGEAGWAPSLEASGLAEPIGDYMSSEYMSDIYDGVKETLSINGKVYAIPMVSTPFILYYNTELFKQAGLDPAKPPKSFDEVVQYADKLSALKDKDGNQVYGFGQTTASVPISGTALTALFYNFGGEVFDEQGNITINNEANKKAMQLLQDTYKKGYLPENAKLKDLRNLFAIGRLGMYFDQSWGFSGISSNNPDASNFTASAPAPSLDGTIGQSVLSSHAFMFMDNGEERTGAAVKFLEFITSSEQIEKYIASAIPAYTVRTSQEGMKAVSDNLVIAGAAGSSEYVKAVFPHAKTDSINLEICGAAQAVTVGGKDVSAILNDLETRINGMK